MAKQIPIMFIRLASRGHNPSHNLQCQGEIGSLTKLDNVDVKVVFET